LYGTDEELTVHTERAREGERERGREGERERGREGERENVVSLDLDQKQRDLLYTRSASWCMP